MANVDVVYVWNREEVITIIGFIAAHKTFLFVQIMKLLCTLTRSVNDVMKETQTYMDLLKSQRFFH